MVTNLMKYYKILYFMIILFFFLTIYSCSLPYPLKNPDDLKKYYLYYEYKPNNFITDGWKIEIYQFRVKYNEEENKYITKDYDKEAEDILFFLTFIFKKTDSVQNEDRFLNIENVKVFFKNDTVPINLTKYYEKTFPGKPFYYDNYMDFGILENSGPLPKKIKVSFDIIIYNIYSQEEIIKHQLETNGKLIK